MWDLYWAIGVIGVVAAVAGVAAGWRLYPTGDWLIMALTALLVGGFAFVWYSAGRLYWAAWVDSSAAIAWTNVTPVVMAIAAGWAWRLPNRPVWRRGLFASLLGLVALGATAWPVLGPILRPPPPPSDSWYDGVAMQSAWANCSPAAAATLLAAEGIPASEREMVELCLTDAAGTPTLGLYRGLKLKADAAGRDVEVLHGRSINELFEEDRWPVLLLVELPRRGVNDPRYEEQWGWVPGLGHSVVCFGRSPLGLLDVGDPAVGREMWTEEDLEVLWHGEGLRLDGEEVGTNHRGHGGGRGAPRNRARWAERAGESVRGVPVR